MADEIETHLLVLYHLTKFVGKPAPRNKEIFDAVGSNIGSAHKVFSKLRDRHFLKIEYNGGARRFVFGDGSMTDWRANNVGDKDNKAPPKPRISLSDKNSKTALENFYKTQKKAVDVRIEGRGILRVYNLDGTPLRVGVPA